MNIGSNSNSADLENPENNQKDYNMRKSNLRWCMLLMACCFMLGNYFCYDNPGPLET